MSLLNEAARTEIADYTRRYPSKRSALLPALHIVQRDHGWISREAMGEVAALLEIRLTGRILPRPYRSLQNRL